MSTAKNIQTQRDLYKKKMAQLDHVLTVRNEVMRFVGSEQFQDAIQVLKKFSEKTFPYQNYKLKIERYLSRSMDLILALESNKNFNGFNSLTRSKQEELKDKYKKNTHELNETLNKIELSYYDLKFKDSQSTGYFIKSFWVAIIIIAGSTLINEVLKGLGENAYTVTMLLVDHLTDLLTKLI